MRTKIKIRTVMVIAVATSIAALLGLSAQPAQADPNWEGLSFYEGAPGVGRLVLHIPDPDGSCTPFPATATWLIGTRTFQDVFAYRTVDCVGQVTGLGNLATVEAGKFLSFRAI
jgi:hypothetical protein